MTGLFDSKLVIWLNPVFRKYYIMLPSGHYTYASFLDGKYWKCWKYFMGYWIEIELFVVWNRLVTKKSLIFSFLDVKKITDWQNSRNISALMDSYWIITNVLCSSHININTDWSFPPLLKTIRIIKWRPPLLCIEV